MLPSHLHHSEMINPLNGSQAACDEVFEEEWGMGNTCKPHLNHYWTLRTIYMTGKSKQGSDGVKKLFLRNTNNHITPDNLEQNPQ